LNYEFVPPFFLTAILFRTGIVTEKDKTIGKKFRENIGLLGGTGIPAG